MRRKGGGRDEAGATSGEVVGIDGSAACGSVATL